MNIIRLFSMVALIICLTGISQYSSGGESAKLLSAEEMQNLEGLLSSYNSQDQVYFVTGCFISTDGYHDARTNYILFLDGAGGELLRFTNGSVFQISVVRYIQHQFSLETQGGMWSSILATDMFNSLIKRPFALTEGLSYSIFEEQSNRAICNTDYQGMNAYTRRSDPGGGH